jgi:hypothetical protein
MCVAKIIISTAIYNVNECDFRFWIQDLGFDG